VVFVLGFSIKVDEGVTKFTWGNFEIMYELTWMEVNYFYYYFIILLFYYFIIYSMKNLEKALLEKLY